MPKKNNLPDSDQKLARKINAILEEKRSVYSSDDYLIDRIAAYRKDLFLHHQNEAAKEKKSTWDGIDSYIRNQKKRTNSLPGEVKKIEGRPTGSLFLKIAAVFILTILLTFIYFQSGVHQPELMVQSGSGITFHNLNEGSTVQLRPNSELYLVSRTDKQVRYRLTGEAYFQVKNNMNRAFVVEAGSGIVRVLGTSFNVREWGGETIVYLEKGSLSFENDTQNVQMQPGQVASAKQDGSISTLKNTEGAKFLSWQDNQIVFENRTAGSIIKELEYHYSIEIRAPEHIESEVLGGTLSLENRDVSLENLGVVLGGNFSSIEGDTYQFVD